MLKLPQIEKPNLGTSLISWIYKQPRSNKFVYAALAVIAGLVIALSVYGQELLPWLKKIPPIAIYLLIFLLSPLVKFLSNLGKDREYQLFTKGFAIINIGRGGDRSEQFSLWQDYSGCTFQNNQVILQPRTAYRSKIRLFTNNNVMEVYSICRERISIAHAEKVSQSSIKVVPPRSASQQPTQRSDPFAKKRHS